MEKRCPNCNGTLKLSVDETKWVCEYCDTELSTLDVSPSSKSEEKELTPAQKLLNYPANLNFSGEGCKKSLSQMCSLINGNNSAKEYLSGLDKISARHLEWATPSVNTDLLSKVRRMVSSHMTPGEEILFYKDSGIIFKGKTGMVLTNQKIIFLNKNGIRSLALSNVESIHFLELILDGCEWYFNSDQNLMLDNMVCSPEEQGYIMALICTMVRDAHPQGYRIKLSQGTF